MEKEHSSLKKENLILKVVCGALLVAGVGLYIYGYLQKDFALAKQEEALKVTVQLKECEVEAAKQKAKATKDQLAYNIKHSMDFENSDSEAED